MIYRSAFETTLGKTLITDKIVLGLKQNMIKHGDYSLDIININLISSINFLPIEITGRYSDDIIIPLFGHPIIIENFKNSNYLALDSRLLVKFDSNDNKIIKNTTEYSFAISRFILNLVLLNEGLGQIKNTLSFGGVIYSHWLSEVISKRYALDPKDQMLLNVISHIYYQTLFYNVTEYSEDFKIQLAAQTVKATDVSSKIVMNVLDTITPMTDIASYCENVKKVLENIRLNSFNSGSLFNIISMSWFGLNSKENINISLEHIPTWLAICYSSIIQKSYKNSLIAKIAERYGKRGRAEEFTKGFAILLKSWIEDENKSQHFVQDKSFKDNLIKSLESFEI